MTFKILCLSIFVIFFQPEYVFPSLESLPLVKLTVASAFLLYLFTNEKSTEKFLANKINRYFVLFAIFQVLSSMNYYVYEGIETFNLWLKIFLTYLLVVQTSITISRVRTIVIMILLGIGYLSIYFFNNFVLSFEQGGIARAYGWYANASDLVLILVTCVPLSILAARTSNSRFISTLFW